MAHEKRREIGDLIEISGKNAGIEHYVERQATGAINVDPADLIQLTFGAVSPPLLGQVDVESDVDQAHPRQFGEQILLRALRVARLPALQSLDDSRRSRTRALRKSAYPENAI